MKGDVHLSFGIAAGVSICMVLPNKGISEIAFIMVGATIGSLLPDLDSPASKISGIFPFLSFLTRLFLGHRGCLHTPFGMVIVLALLLFFIPLSLASFFPKTLFLGSLGVGYMLHLLQDSCTRRGIMWLYPFSRKYYRFFHLRSNGSLFLQYLISLFLLLPFFVFSLLFL